MPPAGSGAEESERQATSPRVLAARAGMASRAETLRRLARAARGLDGSGIQASRATRRDQAGRATAGVEGMASEEEDATGVGVLTPPPAGREARMPPVGQLPAEAEGESREAAPPADPARRSTVTARAAGRSGVSRTPSESAGDSDHHTSQLTGRGSQLTADGSRPEARRPVPAGQPDGPLEIGQAFGSRYHIMRMLGIGGMGAVYHAWDAELEVALALKVVRPDIADNPEAAAEIERRFKRELLLARQVTHPNVVRIHDLGEIDGIKYITMPYVDGRDLSEIIAGARRLPMAEALGLARQIAAGLAAAHAAGVVHRDLKPANIRIDREGRALIMDFGIARSAAGPADARPGCAAPAAAQADATRLGTVIGTVEYMAPEQARGEAVDHRADIYAFGLILSRLLVGRRFATGAADALTDLKARMEAAPPRLREIDASIPEAVDDLVARCLQPRPEDRFAATGDLVAALDGLDDSGAPRPRAHRRTWRFWTLAASLAGLLVAGTWWAAHLVAPPAAEPARAPFAVLIADFSNETGEPVFDGLVEQSLGVGVEGASFVTAYPRPAALRIARQIKAGTRLDEGAARLVALREGVKVVLAGRIEKRGARYLVSAQAVDPASGNVLFRTDAGPASRDRVLAAIAAVSTEVRQGLGDTRPVEAKETFSAASIEAVSEYIKAQEQFAAGNDEAALEGYRRATERDPGFGRAYGGWATAATRLGRREEAEGLWKKALAELDGMTERERYRMLGAYYTLVTRNYDKALDTYATLVKHYPADGAGLNNLAVGYFRKLDFARALEQGRRLLVIYPTSPLYRTNFALYAMYAGDFDTAAREARQLVEERAASYDAYLPLAVAAVAAGDLDGARRAYEEMSRTGAAGASLAAIGLADLALHQGDPHEAARLLRAGIDSDRRTGNLAGATGKQIALAEALLMLGRPAAAVQAARQALDADRAEAVVVPSALVLLAAKRDEEAAKLGSALGENLEAQSRAYGRLVAGHVALAAGHRVQAVEAFREAIGLADLWLARFGLGLAYLGAGAFAEALSEFEACQKRRGEASAAFLDDVPTMRYLAPLDYWIGRSQEGLGLLPQARESYRRFVALRTAGSPDPLLDDARNRLGE
jgi:tetratricopeptide (TPR) repeat protein/TolB-like protein